MKKNINKHGNIVSIIVLFIETLIAYTFGCIMVIPIVAVWVIMQAFEPAIYIKE